MVDSDEQTKLKSFKVRDPLDSRAVGLAHVH